MLIDVIKNIPDWQSLSAQQIVDYLSVVEVIPNTTLYNGKAFEDLVTSGYFSLEEVTTLLGAMKSSPLFEMAFISMSTGEALEFYSDSRQGLIRQLATAAGWSDTFKDKVLALGRTTQARYITFGLTSAPTVEEVAFALNPTYDSLSKEVLFTYNRQSNGQIMCMARVTPVKMYLGQVVERGESEIIVSGDVVDQIKNLLIDL